MATNADETDVVDDDKTVTEEDLRDLKYSENGVETSEEEKDETDKADETDEESEEAGEENGQTEESQDEESEEADKTDSDEESSEFVKEFANIKGDTLEDYARGLETAYKNSTSEALRLKEENDKLRVGKPEAEKSKVGTEIDPTNPVELFMKQKMDEEITEAYQEFSKNYPQAKDPTEYDKFTQEVATLSQTILNSQKRLASPRELYSKAAVILGWEPDSSVPSNEEKLKVAIKNSAAVSKTSSVTKKTPKSKITDAMVAANRLMYPDKSDTEIRKELEPYVQ